MSENAEINIVQRPFGLVEKQQWLRKRTVVIATGRSSQFPDDCHCGDKLA